MISSPRRQGGRSSVMTTLTMFTSIRNMNMMTRITTTMWRRTQWNKLGISLTEDNSSQAAMIIPGKIFSQNGKIFVENFRTSKKATITPFQNPSSKITLQKPKVLSKFKTSVSNVKSQQLKLSSNNGKQEVNNFGFPSSFGQAGVDFPMFDLHR